MRNIALILASGSGSRCGLDFPKQFVKIENKTILEITIDNFEEHEKINEIIIVTSKEYIDKVKDLVKPYKKVKQVVEGGATRKESSYNGIHSISDDEANVLIHDGVRPFVNNKIITDCVDNLEKYSAVCTAIESSDTIFEIDSNNIIKNIPARGSLRRAQTPQCFKLSLIKKAHQLAKNDSSCTVTDDCGLIIHYNLADIFLIEGSIDNIKITYPKDIELLKEKFCN